MDIEKFFQDAQDYTKTETSNIKDEYEKKIHELIMKAVKPKGEEQQTYESPQTLESSGFKEAWISWT